MKVMTKGLDDESWVGDTLVGDGASKHRGVLKLSYPIEHGLVKDWDDMSKIWEYTLEKLNVLNTQYRPVLLTEAPNNPRENKKKAAETFFESFHVPAVYTQVQAILSLYATGKVTGLVLDSGDGVTSAVPVYEGFKLPYAIQRSDVAGRDITEYLQLLLQKGGNDLHTSAEFEIVKDIKEKRCHVAFNFKKSEEDSWKSLEPTAVYPLPDGKEISIGSEMFKAPEVLFNPSIIGKEYDGVHTCLCKAIAKSDLDLRKAFYSSILLSGGSTMFLGFGERLLNELREQSPRNIKIKIYAPRTRLTSAWVGGAILSSLSTFQKLWVSRKDWEEHGERAIYDKFS